MIVLHQLYIAEVNIFYRLEGRYFVLVINAVDKGFTQTLQYDHIVTRQILEETFPDFENLLVENCSFGFRRLRGTTEVEDISQEMSGYVRKSILNQVRMFDIKIL